MKSVRGSKAVPRRLELEEACMIREGDREYCVYPLDRLMTVLGKKWTLFIIGVLGNQETRRFNELLEDLRLISSRTLTDRLRELEALGLVRREAFPVIPPRVEYHLTDEGREMRSSLLPLLDWAISSESSR